MRGKLNVSIPSAQTLAFDSTYAGGAHGFCNWLLPGYIMIGKYPGRIPLQGRPTIEESRDHLEKVLKAGIRTFVCLQSEVPAQDDDAAWATSAPGLFERYIGDVVDLASKLEVGDIKFMHCPIQDGEVPGDPGKFDSIINELAESIEQGSAVYVHCWGGRGRSGVVGACLMLRVGNWQGATAEQAAAYVLSAVQSGYNTRPASRGVSPESDAQVEFVQQFAAKILP